MGTPSPRRRCCRGGNDRGSPTSGVPGPPHPGPGLPERHSVRLSCPLPPPLLSRLSVVGGLICCPGSEQEVSTLVCPRLWMAVGLGCDCPPAPPCPPSAWMPLCSVLRGDTPSGAAPSAGTWATPGRRPWALGRVPAAASYDSGGEPLSAVMAPTWGAGPPMGLGACRLHVVRPPGHPQPARPPLLLEAPAPRGGRSRPAGSCAGGPSGAPRHAVRCRTTAALRGPWLGESDPSLSATAPGSAAPVAAVGATLREEAAVGSPPALARPGGHGLWVAERRVPCFWVNPDPQGSGRGCGSLRQSRTCAPALSVD